MRVRTALYAPAAALAVLAFPHPLPDAAHATPRTVHATPPSASVHAAPPSASAHATPRTLHAAPPPASAHAVPPAPHTPAPAEIAVASREPSCGDRGAADFPLRTRVTGGPAAYRPGAAPRTWYVELTNTTRQACRNIHPVIVLTDRSGALAPEAVRMAFSTAPGDPARPVRMEHTDHRELVGVLDDDTDRAFAGFTVPPSGTVRVPVHLGFTRAARPDRVTATAAVVQRRGDDGDWVGTSAPYAFTVTAPTGPSVPPEPAYPSVPADADPSAAPGRSAGPARTTGPASTPAAPSGTPAPSPTGSPGPAPSHELAGTGHRPSPRLVPVVAAAVGCLALGAAVVVLTRRRTP
ncbi:hypothetical protein [Streptomyces thermolilacinus]|uniref:hypothetical protein n=1 Tax=Streptomyces thermolilacinus TaxID=285540 RepID=UPI0033C4B1D9